MRSHTTHDARRTTHDESRHPKPLQVICGSEDGWRGMREFSLAMAARGHRVTVLIRGALEEPVLSLIAVPDGMELAAVEARWFRLRLVRAAVRASVRRGRSYLVVDKDRTIKLLRPLARGLRLGLVKLTELDSGYRLEGDVSEDLSASAAPLPRAGEQALVDGQR